MAFIYTVINISLVHHFGFIFLEQHYFPSEVSVYAIILCDKQISLSRFCDLDKILFLLSLLLSLMSRDVTEVQYKLVLGVCVL